MPTYEELQSLHDGERRRLGLNGKWGAGVSWHQRNIRIHMRPSSCNQAEQAPGRFSPRLYLSFWRRHLGRRIVRNRCKTKRYG